MPIQDIDADHVLRPCKILRSAAGEFQDLVREALVVAIEVMATGQPDGAGGAGRKVRAQRILVPGAEDTQGLGGDIFWYSGRIGKPAAGPTQLDRWNSKAALRPRPRSVRGQVHVAGRLGQPIHGKWQHVCSLRSNRPAVPDAGSHLFA